MKKLISKNMLFLLLLCTVFTVNGMANEDFLPVLTEVPASKKLMLNMSGFKSDEVLCTIQMENGTLLHSQTINTKIVNNTLFDLSKLDKGSYVIELEDGQSFKKFHININEKDLEVSPKFNVTYKPYITFEEDKYINLNLFTGGKKANVTISDKEGVIYRESIVDEPTIEKRYDIGKLPRGKYIVDISIAGKYTRKEFFK